MFVVDENEDQSRKFSDLEQDPIPTMFPKLHSRLDLLDKTITISISSLPFSILEIPLSIIWNWFGIPILAMALCPLILSSICQTELTFSDPLCQITCLLLLIAVFFWYFCLFIQMHDQFYYVPVYVLVICVLFAQICPSYLSSTSDIHRVYLVSYLVTQTLILELKFQCGRMRPAHALSEKIASFNRFLPRLCFRGTLGHTVFESFPSGDAAGAMVFSVILYEALLIRGWTREVAIYSYLFTILAAHGRIYLFAHHLLDVTVGNIIAFVCSQFVLWVRHEYFPEGFSLLHVLSVMVVFLLLYKQVSKKTHHIKLPRQYISKTGKVWN